ncbi:MAG: phosphatase PAP2 family protein [Chloroflexota bacterium]
MPTDLTIFAAKYLVFIDLVLAAILVLMLLYQRSRPAWLTWGVAAVIMAVLSFVFAKIGAAAYNDPRPFTSCAHPSFCRLIAHAADNGFPSDHALLAAAIVAAILFLAPRYSLPFVILAILIDWARVGSGIHHVADVVGSSLFVAVAAIIAWLVAPVITTWITPFVPKSLLGEESTEASIAGQRTT